MKKRCVIAVLIVFVLSNAVVMGATSRQEKYEKEYPVKIYRTPGATGYSGSQTQLEAVAGTTGVSYVIDKIIFSPGHTRDFFYIEDSAGIVYGPIRCNAFEPFIDNEVLLKLASESAIYVTTEVSGDITINYHDE